MYVVYDTNLTGSSSRSETRIPVLLHRLCAFYQAPTVKR